ncbi:MAG TPA: DUF58 domain-containing protein [Bacilli bacterium]
MRLESFIFFAFIFTALQSFIFHLFGLKRVRYTRTFADRAVFAGDETEMVEEIANNKWLPVPWIRLEASISAHLRFGKQENLHINRGLIWQNHRSLFTLMPFTMIRRRHRIVCLRRGVYRLATVSLTVGDLFGLSRQSRTIPLDAELFVYPQLLPLAQIPLPSHSWLGEVLARRFVAPDPFLTAGVREYQSGDPLRMMHWKSFARTNVPHVRQLDFTADHRLLLYLNVDAEWQAKTTPLDPERIERGIMYAASIAHFTVSQGLATGFVCNGQDTAAPGMPVRIEAGTGNAHMERLHKTFARLDTVRSCSIETLLQQERERGTTQTDILFMTTYLNEASADQIRALKQLGNAVEVMLLGEHESGGRDTDAGNA